MILWIIRSSLSWIAKDLLVQPTNGIRGEIRRDNNGRAGSKTERGVWF